jgi:hypothetical protein
LRCSPPGSRARPVTYRTPTRVAAIVHIARRMPTIAQPGRAEFWQVGQIIDAVSCRLRALTF